MLKLSAQTGTVQGFVIDKDSKIRLAKVYIYNSKKDEGIYNTSKGEFRITAAQGDTLFAVLQGYAVDTIVLKGSQAIYFQLKSLGINLQEVSITGKKLTPQEQYQQRLKEYKYKLDRGSSKDILSVGSGVQVWASMRSITSWVAMERMRVTCKRSWNVITKNLLSITASGRIM